MLFYLSREKKKEKKESLVLSMGLIIFNLFTKNHLALLLEN